MTATDSITLLRDGVEALPAMLGAIAAARHEVALEMYWFDSSVVGRRFAEALAERARAGVAVYVIYDALGSMGVDTGMYQPLLDAGGQVLEFNPIAPWRKRFQLTQISRRDHRKILVVDGEVGFTGGLNIGAPWMPRAEGGQGWRDDVVRIGGPAVARLRELFFDNWRRQGGVVEPHTTVPPPARTKRELTRLASRELRLYAGTPGVVVLGHDAWGARRAIRRTYLSHIRTARYRVLIENAYFVPDNTVRRALERAARRGVEVRVIVPRMSDVPSVTYAGRALFAGLMREGVHVHEWVKGILHTKTGLVDGWATTGSFNLDYRSLRYNLEANVASADPVFVASVEASLRRDMREACEEVSRAEWAHRPWDDKVREWVWYLLRTLL